MQISDCLWYSFYLLATLFYFFFTANESLQNMPPFMVLRRNFFKSYVKKSRFLSFVVLKTKIKEI